MHQQNVVHPVLSRKRYRIEVSDNSPCLPSDHRMNQFLVEFDLPDTYTEYFIAKVPEQRATVHRMMREGKISNYALSLDRRKLWVFFTADDEQEVVSFINEFPLIDHMLPIVHPLMFHESIALQFPAMSLN